MTLSTSRRAFLRGRSVEQLAPATSHRPPWTDPDWTSRCTRCGDCVAACPEQILAPGDGGFPQIRFRGEGCTFCGECASACQEAVFDRARGAFDWVAVIGERCLAHSNIHCMTCQDACEVRAIRFPPRLGRVPEPVLDTDLCNGCTACAAVCPQDAITMETTDA